MAKLGIQRRPRDTLLSTCRQLYLHLIFADVVIRLTSEDQVPHYSLVRRLIWANQSLAPSNIQTYFAKQCCRFAIVHCPASFNMSTLDVSTGLNMYWHEAAHFDQDGGISEMNT
eukprot:6174879-Pleurochrysis_carterae.AAC.3